MTNQWTQKGMENPVDYKSIISGIAVSAFSILGGAYILDDRIESILVSIFMIVMGILVLENEFRSSFIHRPTHVLVKDDGLTLSFRWSEPREVAWEEIELVHTSSYSDGSLMVKDEKYAYFLVKRIAEEIRRKYHLAKGRNPPDMKEYWNNKPDGWEKTWRQPFYTKDKK